MSDHPATFNHAHPNGFDWNDHATIHLIADGGGLFDGLNAIHRGTLAQMVRLFAALPEGERANLVIQKEGDHRLSLCEALALARRSDFPAHG